MLIALALGMLGCSGQSNEQSSEIETTVLRFSHFWPATSAMHIEVFEPWAKKIETESDWPVKG